MAEPARQRDRLDWLSDDEALEMDRDFAAGMTNGQVARKYYCSMRTVQKRKALWLHKAGAPHRKPKLSLPPTPPCRPHMQPGITLDMLMGGKAWPAQTFKRMV